MRPAAYLSLLFALGCARADRDAPAGLEFRAQCFADAPGALAATVQGIPAWFGPPRRFAVDGIHAAVDAQGHPAIRIELAPAETAAFAAWSIAGVAGPVGVFADGELIAVPAMQPVEDGVFTFCNEAAGWTAADRDRALARMRAAAAR